jgi:hypothetical protein
MPFHELPWRANHRPACNLPRGPFGVTLEPAIYVLVRLALVGTLPHVVQQLRQALLHACVEAVPGRFGSPDEKHASTSQNPTCLAQQAAPSCHAAQDLHEQYSIESGVGKRQMGAVRLHPKCRAGESTCREGLKHTQRNVDRRVVIAGCDKGPADAPRPAAEVEHARLCCQFGQDRRPDRCRHAIRQRAPVVETRGQVVVADRLCIATSLGHRHINPHLSRGSSA